jgi:hypothetical protein
VSIILPRRQIATRAVPRTCVRTGPHVESSVASSRAAASRTLCDLCDRHREPERMSFGAPEQNGRAFTFRDRTGSAHPANRRHEGCSSALESASDLVCCTAAGAARSGRRTASGTTARKILLEEHVRYRPLPKHPSVRLSALGFGCMRLPIVGGDYTAIDEDAACRLVRQAIDAGVNVVDTAYPYHGGESESFLGRALKDEYRARTYVATKAPTFLVRSATDWERFLDEQLRKLETRRCSTRATAPAGRTARCSSAAGTAGTPAWNAGTATRNVRRRSRFQTS